MEFPLKIPTFDFDGQSRFVDHGPIDYIRRLSVPVVEHAMLADNERQDPESLRASCQAQRRECHWFSVNLRGWPKRIR